MNEATKTTQKFSVSELMSDRRRAVNLLTAVIMVVIVVVMSITIPSFLTINNIVNVLQQLTTVGMLCLGMTVVLVIGGIDISLSTVLMASATAGALIMTHGGNFLLGIVVTIAVGVLFGCINGFAVARAHMIPFIVTLSTQIIANGFAVMLTNSESIFGLPKAFRMLGVKIGIVPISIPIFFVCAIVMHILLKKTKFGRIFYMIGQNAETAKVSGIRTEKYIFAAYVIAGVCASIAGILLAARTNMAGATMVGNTMIMDVVSAAVIGGASLSGGKGNIAGSILGALFITLISNFINLMGISYYIGLIIKGVLIVLIIGLDRLRNAD